ncbi:MAG: restriction endonuclease subunit S, partial [Epsilonproteobacteria bacterium]|nr:restriction endonuclease subunit S [Campylobacterota bacterium]
MTKNKVPQIRFKGFSGEWKESDLGDKVEFFSGLTYSPNNVVKNNGTLVLRSSNVKDGRIIDADNVYVNSDVVNCSNVQKGDIAVVVRNGSRSLIGKHAQIQKEMKNTVIGAFMTGIRSEQPSFTNALLDSSKFSKEIEKNLGATINQITTGAFKKMIFFFPEQDEQTKIGDYFQQLDKLIEQKEKKYQKLKQFKKAMLSKMFPKNGADTPEIRFKGFSGKWEEKKLGDIGKTFTGLSGKTKEDFGHGEGRFITYMNIFSNPISKHNLTEPIEIDDKQNEVQLGDVFFTTSSETPEEVGMTSI